MEKLKSLFYQTFEKYCNDRSYMNLCWDEVIKNYSNKKRFYHNLNHLQHMFNELQEVEAFIESIDSIRLAVFYHDLIYKVTSAENEEQSADAFEKRISKTRFEHVDLVKEMIIATKFHDKTLNSDSRYFLDSDLAVLGSSSSQYDEYTRLIRKEYQIYPTFLYRRGRLKVLRALLNKPIYQTDYFTSKYEKQAQRNLKRELQTLV
ncbi:hypothetical protein [Nonlabens tegetincola]|uniref:HD domain-containing protein n=1 Tax=Nonlabens tegetincola TaxID=323273 RepID=UPI0030C7C85C